MPNWLEVLILGLATWRVASIIANEDGPFEVFRKIRLWAGEYEDDGVRTATTWYGKGIICCWCVSQWCGFFFIGLYLLRSLIAVYVALPFALSAIAIAWNRLVE